MKYCFDEKIDRSKNHSAKWAELGKKFGTDDLFPMWIADMDIKTAPEIVQAMKEKVEQEIFGYVYRPDSYYKSAAEWLERRFGYKISEKTLIHSPGVVPSLSILVKLMTNEDEKILIQTPVYYPFAETIKDNNRTLVTNELVRDENGYYTMNFDDLEEKLSDEKVTLFILCSPHNPVGRVWKKEELAKVGELCLKYNVRIIADEIWRDIIMPGVVHTPMASISKEIEDITVTCFSPTKTFNIAGLQASFATFPRKEELERFDRELGILDIKRNNPFSLVAFETAYTKCDEWVNQLNEFLSSNMDYAIDFIKNRIPEVKICKAEGTYLLWLDFSSLGFTKEELSEFMKREAKVAMDDGYWFGDNGIGYERMNIACPRYMLEEGLTRIEKAVKSLRK
ncbi:MAG: MalY/PatB family protein [Fusobacterium varium]|jgi:cystathionine beta-lyase|uniref:cysteine-S-conjugate beta-lyase n=1 Tax=Fusobacterium varium ATCC 27725 TaxID=469618 RepID=A0ABM6U744_FUSVA|nr:MULTISPECIES: MalY/PatB family protein [Fusobacterium]AVQ32184.1 pyridoxal phosphate-dependent aminotransferase [Fusobacterium varium ATCC 27725]EES63874.1 putative hemolysin [Fusobacterium varium ATCC 27725]VEH38906.1 Cystathionine beta-lyase PatB [Fusobacterium varium]HBJ77626.1 pyridoxal phosphate-dependent aminotransferase [Fusobacterium sp.]